MLTNRMLYCVCGIAMLAGCAGGPKYARSTDSRLFGTWKKVGGVAVVTLKPNKDYEVDGNGDSKIDARGKYTIHKNEIALTDDKCKKALGIYTFRVRGDKISFTLMMDDCGPRKRDMQGDWARKK